MATIRPKKALGQHFLRDEAVAMRIADTLADYRGRPVLEVGPGTGMLTKHLLAAGHDLSVVEIVRIIRPLRGASGRRTFCRWISAGATRQTS